MSRKPIVKSSVDTGTPPASVRKAKKEKEDLLSDKVIFHDNLSEEAVEVENTAIPDLPKPVYENIKLEHELYSISFGALDVSVSNHQLAIKIPNNTSFRFEPKVDSHFSIVYRNRHYSAVYLGGIFNFESDNSWAITFILDNKEASDDGEKQPDKHRKEPS